MKTDHYFRELDQQWERDLERSDRARSAVGIDDGYDDRGPDDVVYQPGPWRCLNCKQMVEVHPDEHECGEEP